MLTPNELFITTDVPLNIARSLLIVLAVTAHLADAQYPSRNGLVALAYPLERAGRLKSRIKGKQVTKCSNINAVVLNVHQFGCDPGMGRIPAVKTNYPREQKLPEDGYLASDHTL
jgi:hypothetical protein